MERKKLQFSDVVREAKDVIWRYRKRIAVGFVLIIISRLAGFVLPGSTKFFIDEVIGNRRTELLMWLALAVAVATLVQACTSFALSQVLGVAAQRAIMEMRKSVQQHVLRLPASYFDSTKSGVLISRVMTDAEGIRNLVGTGLVNLAGGLLTAAASLGVLFYLNWRLTSGILVVLATFGGAMAFAFVKLRPVFRRRGELNAQLTGRLSEALGGVRVVKAYTAEKREDIVFAHGVHKLFRNIATTVTGVSAIEAFSTFIIGIISVTMIIVGGRAILTETMTLGDLFAYIFFTGLVAAPLVSMASIGTQLSEAFAGLDRIRELKRMSTEGVDDARKQPLPSIRGDVAFEEVWFEYEADTPVLKGVSFRSPAGTTTALVGSSGSGKSTLIGLVMAFHFAKSGRVTVDGYDLAQVRLKDYRSHLGVVLQDNFLFDGTIADNIRYARPHATLEEVRAVSRIAHCDQFIEAFDDQYDTIVGERGIKLSGGQRQRIAIARAVLAEPRILILDEATSSLDSESEALIQDGLQTLKQGRTTFVIAHRLSTIRSADQILVLEDGRIVERGTHAELLALRGRYRELYDKQYQLEANRFINPGEEWAAEEENPVSATQ